MGKILKELSYTPGQIDKGYNNRTLYVNVADNTIKEKPVGDKMKSTFTGGKGFDLWLLWNAVNSNTKWNSPENEICIAAGPLGGTPIYPGAGKSIAVTISPLTGIPIDSNVGGHFGPMLKYAGFDAIEVQGIAEKEVVIFIDGPNHKITIEEVEGLPEDAYSICEELTEKYSKEDPAKISIVCSGTAAKYSKMGILNFSYWDRVRKVIHLKQAGRGGVGTVFSHKNIKAIVATVDKMNIDLLNPADKEGLQAVGRAHSKEIRDLDPKQNEMAVLGTTHLVDIMNDYDLLPTNNYKFGAHPKYKKMDRDAYRTLFHKGFDGCWVGCSVACAHCVMDFELTSGPQKGQKLHVDGPEYETIAGCGSNCGIFDAEHVIEMNFYCDTYGVDTISVGTATAFLMECYENGLITKEHTGGMDLSFGNKESALELLHQMARGEGMGHILGQGIRYMKGHFEKEFGADRKFMEDIGMEAKGLEYSEYMTKESLAQQGGYGMALKGPQHDEAWLIFLDMVHNFMPTFEQKAEALHWFPNFRTWFALNGLCKLPWNDIVPTDNKETAEPAKVIKHVQWYADFFQAVTGVPTTPETIISTSEKVYNFQRIFNLKMGHGKRVDDAVPYRSVGPVTVEEYESRVERYDGQLKEKHGVDPAGKSSEEKVAILRKFREEQYEGLIDAVYKRRGWTTDGVPTVEKAKELGIDFPDVIELLEKNQ